MSDSPSMNFISIPASVIVIVCMCLLVGCSSGDEYSGPELVPVDGFVSLDGKPLPHAQLTFIPTGNTPGQGALAETNERGRFSLQCIAGRSGAAVGTYRVIISKRTLPDGSPLSSEAEVGPMDSAAGQLLPDRYSSFDHSELTATVTENSPLEFHLESKAKRRRRS